MQMQTLKSKSIVDERFEIIELLGVGGMGMVYKAKQLELDRIVALKFLQPHLAHDTETMARFKREAAVLSNLNHRNIVMFYSFGIWHGRAPYIAMEYVDAPDLSDLLNAETGRLTWRRTLQIALQMCEGLSHAHRHGVIHRDLKPSNVFIIPDKTGGDRVKVSDFGLAKVTDEDGNEQKLTVTGYTLGSPHYMSPEQAEGRKVGPPTDVYAVGCVIYQCLFGRPPFDADTAGGVLYQKLNSELSLPDKERSKGLPNGLIQILQTSLDKDLKKRYATMDEMSAAITEVLESSANMKDCRSVFLGGTTTISETSVRSAQRNRYFTIGLVALFVVLIGCLVVFALNLDSFRLTQYDAMLRTARDNAKPLDAVQLELKQIEIFQKAKRSDLLQIAYANLAEDFEPAITSTPFIKSSPDSQVKLIKSVCYALSDAPQTALKRTDVDKLTKVSTLVETTAHDVQIGLFFNAAVLRLRRTNERSRQSFVNTLFQPCYDVLCFGPNAQFAPEVRHLLSDALGKDPRLSDVELERIADQVEIAAGFDSSKAVEISFPIYFSYVMSPSAVAAKSLERADAAITKATHDHCDSGTARILFNYDKVLQFYHSRICDDASIQFYQRALANADRINEWNVIEITEAQWREQFGGILLARDRPAEALKQYERTIDILETNKTAIRSPEQICCVLLQRADCLRSLGRTDEANAGYKSVLNSLAVRRAPKSVHANLARLRLGSLKQSAFTPEFVLAWTEKVLKSPALLEKKVQWIRVKMSHSAALRSTGKYEAARQDLLDVLKEISKEPGKYPVFDRDLYRVLSSISLLLNDEPAAMKYAQQALQRDIAEKHTTAFSCCEEYYDRSLIAMLDDRLDEAELNLRFGLALLSDVHLNGYPEFLTALAKVRARTGDHKLAKEFATEAMRYYSGIKAVNPNEEFSEQWQDAQAVAASLGVR